MPAAFVRSFGGISQSSSSTVSVPLTTSVAPGNVLVVWVAFDNLTTTSPTVSSITTPGGVTWSRAARVQSGQSAAGAGIHGELWVAKFPTGWAQGNNVGVALSGSVVAKAVVVSEFSGVEPVVVGSPSTAWTATVTPASVAFADDGLVNPGDLVLGAYMQEHDAPVIPATASEFGAQWSSGYGVTANSGTGQGAVQALLQYIVAAQTDSAAGYGPGTNAGATADSGVVILALQATPSSAVTTTGSITAAPILSSSAVARLARDVTATAAPVATAASAARMVRTGDVAGAPALSAAVEVVSTVPARLADLAVTPTLSAAVTVQAARTGTATAAPTLSAASSFQVSPARSGTVTVAPSLSASAVVTRVAVSGTLAAPPPVLTAGWDIATPPGPLPVGDVDLRLVAYAPNGASLGLLPAPDSFQFAIPLNDTPSLSGVYALGSARSDLLGKPLELAVEMTTDGGDTWTEPDDARFLYLTDGRDPIKTADAYALEAKGYVWRLSKARVLGEGKLSEEGRRDFNAVTAGGIIATLWNEATARGALSGMTLTGAVIADASGAPWSVTLNRSYDVGTDYLTILLDLAADGYLDFRMTGRILKLYVPDTTLAKDRTVGDGQVQLTPLQVNEAPFRRTWEGLADFIHIMGDEGVSTSVTNPTALKPWGRWEDFITAGGISDPGTLTAIGQKQRDLSAAERAEFTQGLALGNGPAPLAAYSPGDYVWSRTLATGSPARYRVRQVTLQKEGGSVQGNVVLNDRFLEEDIRTRRALNALTSGAGSGSTGPAPVPPGADILQPAAPGTLTASSATYTDASGTAWAQVSLDWPDVTTNRDGTPITDLDHYEVHGREGQKPWQELTRTTDSIAYMSPFLPTSTWEFRVRAVDASNNFSEWSQSLSVLMAEDTTGPVKPSTPTAQARLGNGTVTWDGLAYNGAAMDPDFSHVEVHLSTTPNFTATAATKATTMPRAGSVVVGPLTYGSTYYGRLVPYDRTGNPGTPSENFSFVVAPLVDVSNFPDTAMETLYARTGHFITIDADQITGNTAAIGFIETGTITGGIFQASDGGEFRTNATPTLGGIRIRDADGFTAWANGGGTPTVTIDRTTGKLTARGGDFLSGTVSGGTVQSASGGTRVVMTTAANPAESGSAWGLLEFYNQFGWNPGRLWASGTSSEGQLRLSSPYSGTDWTRASAITLKSDSSGFRTMNLYAQKMEFTANNYTYTSYDGTSVDFRLASAGGVLAVVDGADPASGFGRIRFAILGGSNLSHQIAARDAAGDPTGMELRAGALMFTVGSAQPMTIKKSTGSGTNPILTRTDTFPSVAFDSDKVKITTWDSSVLQPLQASNVALSSDMRYKSAEVRVEGALAAIKAVPVYDYDTPHGMAELASELAQARKPGTEDAWADYRYRQRGVMAQDLRKVVPHAVYEDDLAPGSPLSVDVYGLLATAIAAIQELAAEVATLKAPSKPEGASRP